MKQHVTDKIVEWMQANPQGATSHELVAMFGGDRKAMAIKCNHLRVAGKLVSVVDRWEGPRWIARYLHASHPKPPDAVKPTPLTPLERKRKQLGIRPEAMKVGVPARGANAPGEPIIPKGVKIQRAETPKPRFYVDQAPSIFGSLALGTYLPSETHLSKVYGG